jgi:hypothetical protein
MLNDQQLYELNEDVLEFIEKLKLQYPEPLAVAAALTQHGLRHYKQHLNPDEFAHLLIYTIETNRLL